MMYALTGCGQSSKGKTLPDGTYSANVTMEGGTGKAYIESPTEITVADGLTYAKLIWSSKNYDYMLVNGEKFINEAEPGGPSVFTIPIETPDCTMTVIGDTTAMSVPHEIEYTLTFEMVK